MIYKKKAGITLLYSPLHIFNLLWSVKVMYYYYIKNYRYLSNLKNVTKEIQLS